MENKNSITKSAIAVSFVSVITLAFSFLKESVFAYFFGANSVTDAYTVAIQIPTVVFSLVATAISNVVLPYYAKEKATHGQREAERYASNLITVISIISVIIVVACFIFSNSIVRVFAPGLENESFTLAVKLFRIILPTIILTQLMNINTSIMNVHKSFIIPSMMSMILNITFVSCVIILASSFGIKAAVIGTILGIVLEFTFSVLVRRKYMKYRLICDIKDSKLISSTRKALPIFVGIGAAEINKLIDTAVSSFLEQGSISLLNYASKLSTAISGILIQGVVTVVYPEFAESAAIGDHKGVAKTFEHSIKMIALLIMPVIFGGTIISKEIISVVYQRGSFNYDAVIKTAPLFSCYLVCILFTAFRQITSRVFYSYGDTKTPMRNSMIGIAINIVLDFVLSKYFCALGLALATTISTACISILLFIDIKRRNEYIEYSHILKTFTSSIIACLSMIFCLYAGRLITEQFIILQLGNIYQTILAILLNIIVGFGVYFFVLNILRESEIKDVLKIVRRKK